MKLTKIWLFLVALFATVCLLGCPDGASVLGGGGSGGSGDDEEEEWVKPVYDPKKDETEYFETVPANPENVKEVVFFNFNNSGWALRAFAPEGDGATIETAKGQGILGTDCIHVKQTAEYGQIMIRAQDAYSKGKTYYFEAWFRDDTDIEVNKGASMAHLSITVYDKDIEDIAAAAGTEYWAYDSEANFYDPEQPSPYEAEAKAEITGDSTERYTAALTPYLGYDEEEEELGSISLSKELRYDSWRRVNAIVYSNDIDYVVSAKTENDLVGFFLNFYCGSYPEQAGYEYFVDNIRVLDLNPEIPEGEGRHVDPPSVNYGSSNNLEINIFEEKVEDEDETVYVYFAAQGERATYTIEGDLPTGLELKDSGDLEGDIPVTLVEEGADPKVYTVTITATNKKGTVTETVTITIKNSNPKASTGDNSENTGDNTNTDGE